LEKSSRALVRDLKSHGINNLRKKRRNGGIFEVFRDAKRAASESGPYDSLAKD
jgi:hypothetical protein